jgi:hypothetical protein
MIAGCARKTAPISRKPGQSGWDVLRAGGRRHARLAEKFRRLIGCRCSGQLRHAGECVVPSPSRALRKSCLNFGKEFSRAPTYQTTAATRAMLSLSRAVSKNVPWHPAGNQPNRRNQLFFTRQSRMRSTRAAGLSALANFTRIQSRFSWHLAGRWRGSAHRRPFGRRQGENEVPALSERPTRLNVTLCPGMSRQIQLLSDILTTCTRRFSRPNGSLSFLSLVLPYPTATRLAGGNLK